MSTPETHITQTLQSLQKDLFDLSARNPLVQVDWSKLWLTDDDTDFKLTQKIYQKARFFEKEYGLNTSLLITHFIRWKRLKDETFYTSPLICRSVNITEKKREQVTHSVTPTDETLFINPVLRKLFLEEFQLELPESIESPESLIELLLTEFKQLKIQKAVDSENTWQLIEKNAVGIFNYKKLLLARDYEKIQLNPGKTLSALFGEETRIAVKQPETDLAGLLDISQKRAIQSAVENHVVIQGPPGTGKSQTIVSLIKTLLHQNKKVLFVSEKRSALDVVFQRLKKEKLDLHIAFFNPDKDEKKQFYSRLKKTWEWASDNKTKNNRPTHLPPSRSTLFSFYPERLLNVDPKTGTSIQELLEKLLSVHFDPTEIQLQGNFPDYPVWQKHLETLYHFETLVKNEFKAKSLTDTAFFELNSAVFSEPDPARKLATRIDQVEKSLEKIHELINQYNLTENPDAFLRLAIAASIMAMVNKNQLDLLQKDHKKYKAFNTLAKKYQLTKNKLQQAEVINQKWSKKPSIAEITELNDLLKQKKKSKTILGILKRNSARSQDYFADFSPMLATVTKLQLLEEVRTEWHLQGELEALKIRLKHELNILNPDTEIDHILQVRTKLNSVSQNEYITLLEHKNSLDLIRDLSEIHGAINHTTGLIAYLFYQPTYRSFHDLKNKLNQLKNELERVDQFHYELTLFFKIPDAVLNFIRMQKSSIRELDTLITWKQLSDETRFEPAFKKLSGSQLLTDFEEYSSVLKRLTEEQSTSIRQRISTQLAAAEKRAETPASKLKSEEKTGKQKFKDAKRTLIHEFTKKQQHIPVIELMQQHAETVLLLQPVWMMNPLSVAQFLPCEEALFDFVIFDEASQVPLEDAIPAIYRGAQVVVVGDSQQMPPGQFFSSNPDGKTVLDQAEYNFTNVLLKSHYRSEHPDLIVFSNKHFYDFELSALPPVTAENPIQLIKVNGIFEDNRNLSEAREIARFYQTLLQQGKTDVGIIAFSKEQQTEIEKQVALLRLPENEALVIRNLENVQGIEKEIILLSIGYGKNKEGLFRKNFGPVNRERGANRLNVLFTRAIQKMIVFASVSAADFELSENRGTTILADFLRYAEEQEVKRIMPKILSKSHQLVYEFLKKYKIESDYYSSENGIGISCFVQHDSKKILLVDPCINSNETTDLFSLLHALKNRFSGLKIILTGDLIFNKVNSEKEILKFFNLP